MRFTIDKEALIKGLTLVSKASPPKAEIPIFKDFGATVSGECLFGDFKNKENLKRKT